MGRSRHRTRERPNALALALVGVYVAYLKDSVGHFLELVRPDDMHADVREGLGLHLLEHVAKDGLLGVGVLPPRRVARENRVVGYLRVLSVRHVEQAAQVRVLQREADEEPAVP